MIVYSLPNGKVIHLTVEQFLRLTEDDLSLLNEQNYGRSCNSPFVNIDEIEEEDIVENDYINLFDNDDETDNSGPINLDQLFED
jgi:hypothetical protein